MIKFAIGFITGILAFAGAQVAIYLAEEMSQDYLPNIYDYEEPEFT